MPTGGGLLWKVPTLDDESLVPTLQGIVIKARNERAYYRDRFSNTRSRRPPDCASIDALTGIGTPGGDCRTCRLAQFGSGAAGGPACRLFTSLLFLPSDSLLPVVVPVPPMSVQVHEAFVRKLKDAGMGNWDAMIELGLTKTTNRGGMSYARIAFRLVRKLDADEIERLRQWVRALWPPRPGEGDRCADVERKHVCRAARSPGSRNSRRESA